MRFGPDDDTDLGHTLPDPEELPEPIRNRFVGIVILLNVGLLLASVGIMLIGFERRFQAGGVLVLAGIIVLGRAWQRYRSRDEVFERVR
ncbi:MAG: hypothetical protein ABEJ55_06135 [Halanaeroarchaeum sp.]